MKISGNAAVDNSNTSFAWNFWNQSGFGPDSEAYMTVATYGSSDVIRVGGRVTGGTPSYTGYFVSVSSTGVWSFIRLDTGTPTTLTTGPTQALASGDKVGIRIVGTTLTGLHYTPAGGWVQVLSYDTSQDATQYSAAGSLALEFKTSTVDDFGGGTITASNAPPVNTSLPTISGTTTVGQQLTASPGSWTGTPAPTFTYQWIRCDSAGANCNPIGSATNASYTLVGSRPRQQDRRRRHRHEHRRERNRHLQPRGADQPDARQHVAADRLRHDHGRSAADGLDRQLDRHPSADVHLPMDPLQQRGRQLQRDQRRHSEHLHHRERR